MEPVITVDLKPLLYPRGAHYDSQRPIKQIENAMKEHFQLKIRDRVKRRILMFSAMTSGSNHTVVITRTGVERDCCMLRRQQKARSDNFGYFSHSNPQDPNLPKSQCYRARVKFCFKDKVRMEQKEQTGDLNGEGTNGGKLRELASKWFIDTQLPVIINNGLFPSWFMGFINRKDAENLLKDKELGCYLIRLSDKAIGYILSYKGRDRFRHFVISQSETGKFVVSGDNEGHNTVLKLIEHYKTIPIEPFGEYLTCPCFKDHSEDLYDIIRVSPKDKTEVVLKAAKNMQKHITSASVHQPAWQPKSNQTEEEVPPLPRRSRHLDTGTFTDQQDRVVYAQLHKQTVKENPRTQHVQQDNLTEVGRRKVKRSNAKNKNNGRCSPPSVPETVHNELNPLDSKSKSLPLLDSSPESEQSYRLRVPPDTPPRLSPKPVRQAASYVPQSNSSKSLDGMSNNAVYHLAGPASFNNRSSTAEQQSNSLYTEVAIETPVLNQDNTYELIPDHKEPVKPNSSYEPVEDSKRKSNNSSWGIKTDKWKWLFPETKRKW